MNEEKIIKSMSELHYSLKNEISEIKKRIYEKLIKIKDKHYTFISNEQKQKILIKLIKANEELGKSKMMSSIYYKNEEYANIIPGILDDRYLFEKILEEISTELLEICKDCYNRKFVYEISHFINDMGFEKVGKFKEIYDDTFYKLNVINFIQSKKEIYKLVEIMNLIKILKSDEPFSYSNTHVYDLIGAKKVLLDFEVALDIIPKIEDKSLKNAVIDYILNFVELV